jgi:hypothetical protein
MIPAATVPDFSQPIAPQPFEIGNLQDWTFLLSAAAMRSSP